MNTILALIILFNLQINQTSIEDKINYHNSKADFYYHKGNYPNMLYHLIEKIKLDKHDVNTYSDISYYYWSLSVESKDRKDEFKEKSLKYLLLGLENNKDTAYLWDELGNYYMRVEKDDQKAIKYYEESLKRKDVPISSFHLLSLLYLKNNQENLAVQVLEKCIIKYPNDEKAKSKLKQLKYSKTNG